MANLPSITRRAAVIGAAASTAALAVPAAHAAHLGEHPWYKVRRLAKELSAALEELRHADTAGGDVVALVEPAGKGDYAIAFMDRDFYYTASGAKALSAEPRARMTYHLRGLEAAARQIDPTIRRCGLTWDADTGAFMGIAVSYPANRFGADRVRETTT